MKTSAFILVFLCISCVGRESTPEQPASDRRADSPAAEGGACLRQGEESLDWSARFPGEVAPVCCEGLDRLPVYDATSLDDGQCIVSKGPRFVCARGGDTACDLGENRCNSDDCR